MTANSRLAAASKVLSTDSTKNHGFHGQGDEAYHKMNNQLTDHLTKHGYRYLGTESHRHDADNLGAPTRVHTYYSKKHGVARLTHRRSSEHHDSTTQHEMMLHHYPHKDIDEKDASHTMVATWWGRLSHDEQEHYLKKHPGSRRKGGASTVLADRRSQRNLDKEKSRRWGKQEGGMAGGHSKPKHDFHGLDKEHYSGDPETAMKHDDKLRETLDKHGYRKLAEHSSTDKQGKFTETQHTYYSKKHGFAQVNHTAHGPDSHIHQVKEATHDLISKYDPGHSNANHWWGKMNKGEQADYIKKHPKTQLKVTASLNQYIPIV